MARTYTATDLAINLDHIADPRAADPSESVEQAEQETKTRRKPEDGGIFYGRHTHAVLLMGRRAWVYPVLPPDEWGRCPVCLDGRLGPTTACLNCLRSGIDHRLPKALPLPVDPPESVNEWKADRQAPLGGGTGPVASGA